MIRYRAIAEIFLKIFSRYIKEKEITHSRYFYNLLRNETHFKFII